MTTKLTRISSFTYSLQRAVGVLAIMTKSGPAAQRSFFYRLLKLVGVLETMPQAWNEGEELQKMPWGANSIEAPPSAPPPGFDGLWPQEPVIDARFAAPVLHLPRDEKQPHRLYNVTRYLGQVICLSPMAAMRTLVGPRLAPLDEKTFQWILTETSLAQFINPQLDPADRQTFAPIIGSDDIHRYAKIDCSGVALEQTLPDIHLAPTVTLLRRTSADHYQVVAIRVGDAIFTPADGAAWELARYCVLQGAQLLLVVIMHPRLHFPMDTINAISQMTLPRGHLLYKLLIPHTTYTLGLHEAVIHHRRSVVHNSQQEIYTPFPVPTKAIHEGVARGLQGIAGNSSYPAYRFGGELLGDHTGYGRFRAAWFEHILAFTTQVTAPIPNHDPYVQQWADHIHQWLPGFPDGHAIFAPGRLAEAAALYIATVSVFHTGDHHSYAQIPLKYLPFRLRRPGPHIERPARLKLDELVSREDFFRHQLSHAMFFKPVLITNLPSVRYYFQTPALKQAEREFIRGMSTLDRQWPNSTFPAAHHIAASLQY